MVYLIITCLGAASAGIVIWRQAKTISEWKKKANDHQEALWRKQGELHEARMHNQQLADGQKCYLEQLDYWLRAGNCFEQDWVIVGAKEVRKSSGYERDELNELLEEHLGQKDNVFEPMPPPPTKLLTVEVAREPALLLTKVIREGLFKVVVFGLNKMDKFPRESLAEVDVCSANDGWSFDIHHSANGTGALSFAFDYILACAKKQGILHLTAPLTYIKNEAHRIRLSRFYAGKYGFVYVPSLTNPNGYITKKLS